MPKKKAMRRTTKKVTPASAPRPMVFRYLCKGALPAGARAEIGTLILRGKAEEARRLKRASRSGCGFDLTPVIATLPRDGTSHPYSCPSCHRVGHATNVVPPKPPNPVTAAAPGKKSR